jgi:hypothetical protein
MSVRRDAANRVTIYFLSRGCCFERTHPARKRTPQGQQPGALALGAADGRRVGRHLGHALALLHHLEGAFNRVLKHSKGDFITILKMQQRFEKGPYPFFQVQK